MEVQNLEVTTEVLLNAVVQMPEEEVDKLYKEAKRLRRREAELVDKIKNLDLSPENQKIYKRLIKKFRAEKITLEEHKKLMEIIDEFDDMTIKRLKWLYEISQIRQQPFDEVVKEFDIKPKNYG